MLLKKIEGRYINPNQIVEVDTRIFNIETNEADNLLIVEYDNNIYLSNGDKVVATGKLELDNLDDIRLFVEQRELSDNVRKICNNITHDYIQNNIENER